MRLLTFALIGGATLLCQPAMVWASDDTNKPGEQRAAVSPDNLAAATRHFDDATQFYRTGKFDEARIEFEAAFALTHDAELLHNLSLTSEKQGKLSDAIDFEERFLAAKPQGVSERDSDEARGRIARLRDQLAGQRTLTPVPVSTPPTAAASDRRPIPPAAVGLMAAGGVVLAVGIGCGAGAWATARNFDMPLTVSESDALTARGQALDRAGISLDVLGGVGLAAGIVWAAFDRSRSRRSSTSAWLSGTSFVR